MIYQQKRFTISVQDICFFILFVIDFRVQNCSFIMLMAPNRSLQACFFSQDDVYLFMQGRLFSTFRHNIWDKVFKNGPSKICGRQPLKNLKGHGLYKQIALRMFKGCLPQILLGPFLNALSHKLHLQSTHLKSIYIPFLYPLRTSKNLWFSDVFRGYGTLA